MTGRGREGARDAGTGAASAAARAVDSCTVTPTLSMAVQTGSPISTVIDGGSAGTTAVGEPWQAGRHCLYRRRRPGGPRVAEQSEAGRDVLAGREVTAVRADRTDVDERDLHALRRVLGIARKGCRHVFTRRRTMSSGSASGFFVSRSVFLISAARALGPRSAPRPDLGERLCPAPRPRASRSNDSRYATRSLRDDRPLELAAKRAARESRPSPALVGIVFIDPSAA